MRDWPSTGTREHDTLRDDPCHLAWQVSEIPWLDSTRMNSTRPLPARPAGESDSNAVVLELALKML